MGAIWSGRVARPRLEPERPTELVPPLCNVVMSEYCQPPSDSFIHQSRVLQPREIVDSADGKHLRDVVAGISVARRNIVRVLEAAKVIQAV